jgi:DNA repair exonuclease SbcCD nuclease subunit
MSNLWAAYKGGIVKFLCTADWHVRKENPKYRKDDYLGTQIKKIEWIVKTANKLDACLLIAGDIFDSPKAGYAVTNQVAKVLKKANHKVITCFGNHDTTFHSQDLSNTPYGNLIVNNVIIENETFFEKMHSIRSWGWESSGKSPEKGDTNILLGHVSVFEKEVPFWCENGITAKQVKKLYPGFDWYVFGDIHIPFVSKNIINPGSLTRSTIAQTDFKPRVYLLDTDDGTIKKIMIPIKPAEEVFNFEQQEMDKMKDVKALNSFIDTLKYSGNSPNFRNVLDDVIKQSKASEEVIEIINTVLEEI